MFFNSAAPEQCSVFGKRLFVFGVLFGVRFLNVFDFAVRACSCSAWGCSADVSFCSMFGYLCSVCCASFGVRMCSASDKRMILQWPRPAVSIVN